MSASTNYPGIRQAIWLLVLAFLATLGVTIIVMILGEIWGFPLLGEHPAVMGFCNLAGIGLVLIWGRKKSQTPFAEVFPLTPIPVSLLLPLVLTILGMHLVISELDNFFRTFLPMPAALAKFFVELVSGEKSFWGSWVLVVIIAPLTEELLFRGLILRGFLSRYSEKKAILASALLFGAFHMNPWQFLGATIIGVLLAWLYVRTGSLLPCLFAHALNNAVPVIVLSFFSLEIPGYTTDISEVVEFQPLWLDLTGLLLAGLGLWLLVCKVGEGDTRQQEISNDDSRVE